MIEKEAYDYEVELIAYYKNINQAFCNISEGGEGGNGLYGENHPNSRPIVQLSLKGEYIKEWINIIQAEQELNLRNISSCCNDKTNRKKSGEYLWMYKEEYDKYKDNIKEYKGGKCAPKSVVQLTLDGEFVEKFDSTVEAEKILGINHVNISSSCRNNNKRTGDYIWMYYDDYINNKTAKTYIKEDHSKKVIQLSLDNVYIRTYDSLHEASNINNLSLSNISACCNHRHKQIGGYKWMFEEEYENNKDNLSEIIVIRNNPINIVQLDKNGHFIEEYDSLAKAQKNTKISANTILNKCKNGQVFKGCKWMFSKDYYSQNN